MTEQHLVETGALVEDATPGTWLIQTGKPRGRHVRRCHYFAEGQAIPVCGVADFSRKPGYVEATRPRDDYRLAIADDPTFTHHGSDDRLDRTVCGNCLHELRVRAGTEKPRTWYA